MPLTHRSTSELWKKSWKQLILQTETSLANTALCRSATWSSILYLAVVLYTQSLFSQPRLQLATQRRCCARHRTAAHFSIRSCSWPLPKHNDRETHKLEVYRCIGLGQYDHQITLKVAKLCRPLFPFLCTMHCLHKHTNLGDAPMRSMSDIDSTGMG